MGSMKDFQGEERTDAGSFGKGMILGMLAGGAFGAAAALLFAPKSGVEIRSDLSGLANRYADRTGDSVNDATERARQIVNDGRLRADTIIDDARNRASSLLHDAERIVNDARKRARSAAGSSASEVKEKADKLAEATRAGVEAFKEELSDDPTPAALGKKKQKSDEKGKSSSKPQGKAKG